LGATEVSRAKPVASVGAVIAVLRSCPFLETLHIVFDGSIPPPPPMMMLDVDSLSGTQHGEWAGGGEESGGARVEEGKKGRVTTSRAPTWGISNQHITQIHVGHSPIAEDRERMRDLISCLRSVMPRLGRIQSKKRPSDMFDMFDMSESEGWRTAQRLLVENHMNYL